jgi:hypothetical protein
VRKIAAATFFASFVLTLLYLTMTGGKTSERDFNIAIIPSLLSKKATPEEKNLTGFAFRFHGTREEYQFFVLFPVGEGVLPRPADCLDGLGVEPDDLLHDGVTIEDTIISFEGNKVKHLEAAGGLREMPARQISFRGTKDAEYTIIVAFKQEHVELLRRAGINRVFLYILAEDVGKNPTGDMYKVDLDDLPKPKPSAPKPRQIPPPLPLDRDENSELG